MLDTMMSKRPQLGRIRQWSTGLGAKLSGASSIDPTFKQEIAGEIEQRGIGNANLYAATEAYWSYLAKKKPLPFDSSTITADDSSSVSSSAPSIKPESKMLPIEALGLAMSSFGNAFGPASKYGSCLSLLGEAHIKLAALQAAFAKDTSNIFLSRIARSKTAIHAFHAAIKKLDAATARLDAAQAKVQKSKKEKRQLEEELRLATAAYHEAVSDVEIRADAIQASEHDDLDCLSTYMQAHLDYLAQMHAILENVSNTWHVSPSAAPKNATPPTMSRSRSRSRSRTSSVGSRPPPLPRRSSTKESNELSRPSSRMTSRSSVSLSVAEADKVANGKTSSEDDYAGPSADRETGTNASTAKRNDKEKKGRLRMPSFSGAGDAVTSMASGIGSFSRSKSSALISAASADKASPDREKDMSSRWSLLNRSKKESGFAAISDQEQERERGSTRLLDVQPVHNKVSSEDVDLGPLNGSTYSAHMERRSSVDEASPFSPDPQASSFSRDDTDYLGVSAAPAPAPALVGMNHTGQSTFSDGYDPFSGGLNGMMLSPQGTGQGLTDDDDDEHERQALTGARSNAKPGAWASLNLPFANGNGNGNGNSTASASAYKAVKPARGPPPPVPSSAAFLSKSKPPPPPPLPARNQLN